MGYIGPIPAQVPLTSSDIEDGIITADKLATDAVETVKVKDVNISAAKLATDAVETTKIKDLNVTAGKMAATQDLSTKTITLPATVAGLGTGINVTNQITGIVPAANLGTGTASSTTILYGDGTYKTEPTTDLQSIKADISALALREATNEASAAFNLPNQFIDTFATDVLGTKTDVGVSGGYVASTSGETLPTGTIFYMKGDNANGNTTFTDSSASPLTTSANGGVTHSDNQGKIGSTSIFFDGNGDYLSGSYTSSFDFGTGEFRIEAYVLFPHSSAPNTHATIWTQGGFGALVDYAGTSIYIGTNGKIYFHSSANQTGAFGSWTTSVTSNALTWTEDQWYHISVERDADGVITMWRDGTETTYDATTGKTGNTNLAEGDRSWTVGIPSDLSSNGACEMFIDNFLIAKGTGSARGASYTPTTAHYGIVTSATGTAIQAANAVASPNKTKVGGTMLYKDNAGTATLGTDLKIYFTANGGSNWTEAASYNAITPVYSTGIKQVRLGETTVTGGTDVRYKAVWANQAASSKETQLHGIGINY